jgi:hypothetical protein
MKDILSQNAKATPYLFHPLAKNFRLMNGVEFNELVADVKKNGLREKITLYQDKILDGRNRYRSTFQAGVKPQFEQFEGNDAAALAFVISKNIHRRHLKAKEKYVPWSNTRLVYLIDPETAEMFTFSTSSWGGRSAVSELGDQILRMRCGKPNAVPLVELCASPMITKFGRKSKPHLKVIEWRNTGSENVEEISDRTESERALDDQLPF